MRRTMLKSKIHRATITGSDLNYVGSIAVDAEYSRDDLETYEPVVVHVDRGNRIVQVDDAVDRLLTEARAHGALGDRTAAQ